MAIVGISRVLIPRPLLGEGAGGGVENPPSPKKLIYVIYAIICNINLYFKAVFIKQFKSYTSLCGIFRPP